MCSEHSSVGFNGRNLAALYVFVEQPMTGINALIDAFDDAVRRACGPEASPETRASEVIAAGLNEDHAAYSEPNLSEQVSAAEARVLGYRTMTPSELLAKADFILREMRKLTDEVEEFDGYADRLRADLSAVLQCEDGGQNG